ncbi:DUF748 domain-containing protein [Catalinimonas niigatensis]|uniref:DUF748 domain-containing protein n=1 Tax=Catalinimonas niigatensis TaxID=1397264 RepID=UPI002665755E|nr:DUF748 domain-containing protein [Catalinimonas niigatensis]WPP53222.1 DUF748 domain-containing protein [Catalinimonas niigatensis]
MRWKLFIAILAGLLLILLISLPYIAKWYLEKYDQELLGREIEVEDIDVNLFTGKLGVENLRILEEDRQQDFLTCRNGQVFISWWKFFSDDIYMREVVLDGLQLSIIQEGEQFNFDDLLLFFASEDTIAESSGEAYNWYLEDLLLSNSSIHYQDKLIGSSLALDSIQISSTYLSSENPQYNFDVCVRMKQGIAEASLTLDIDRSAYTVKSNVHQFPFSPFQPYLEQFIRLSAFDSRLDADIILSGKYAQPDHFALRGDLHLRDFVMIDARQDSLMAWTDFVVEVDSLDTQAQLYNFGNIRMYKPYLRLVNSPEGDNFSLALVSAPVDSLYEDSLTVQSPPDTLTKDNVYVSPFEFFAKSLYELTQEYVFVNYLADSIAIEKGLLDYYDYTLQDSFYMELSQLTALATEVEAEDQYTHFDISARLDKTGNLVADLEISRSGIGNMLFDFRVDNVYLSNFNPYSKYYVAHPFVDGKVIFSSKNNIKDYFLSSNNNLFVEQIAVGSKDTANALYELPMKLAVALLKDMRGNVDLNIPVEGQLNDPKYKLWRTIFQVLKNILLKVVTAPYRLLANAIGGDPGDLKSITFNDLQYDIQQEQARRLKSIAKVLKQKPEFKLNLVSVSDSTQEKSILALKESWADYQSSLGMVSQDSSMMLPSLTSLDSSFYQFIHRAKPAFDFISAKNIAAACVEYTGKVQVDTLYRQLWRKRQEAVRNYLLEVEALPEDRLLFVSKAEIPTDSLTARSHFLIEYRVE